MRRRNKKPSLRTNPSGNLRVVGLRLRAAQGSPVPELPRLPKFPGEPKRDTSQKGEHFRECDICGQRFDTTDLDQVFHHDGNPHERLPTKA